MFESLVCFLPRDPAKAACVSYDRGHRLVWRLFEKDGAARDFLYQPITGSPFRAVVRSKEPPRLDADWRLERLEGKENPYSFAPCLEKGQALAFRVEAVPFRWRPVAGAKRGTREDLVTAVRRAHPEAREDTALEACLVAQAARRWLAGQGETRGFATVGDPALGAYDQEIRRREGRSLGPPLRFASIVFEGRLQVTEADKFRSALYTGLGAEKAFGFGLIQIAPAPAGGGVL